MEDKINVMRMFDKHKLPYTSYSYEQDENTTGEEVAARLGMDPASVFPLLSAMERDLCPRSHSDLVWLQEPASRFAVPDYLQPESKPADFIARLPHFLQPLASRLTTPVPKIRTAECVGCGKCAESCPQHTISIRNRKAVIDYSKCIRCYCCHEMCPQHVIDIRRFSLFRH